MTNTLYDALIAPHSDNASPFMERDDGVTITYSAFVKRAAQIAHVLADNGVTPGDRILVQAPKLSDSIALYAAALQCGGVYLPLNTAYTHSELSYFVQDASPRLIVCDSSDAPRITALAADVGAQVLTLGQDGGSLSLAANDKPTTFDTATRGADDLAALLYTSGTTGRSKGAMLSHRNLLSNASM